MSRKLITYGPISHLTCLALITCITSPTLAFKPEPTPRNGFSESSSVTLPEIVVTGKRTPEEALHSDRSITTISRDEFLRTSLLIENILDTRYKYHASGIYSMGINGILMLELQI